MTFALQRLTRPTPGRLLSTGIGWAAVLIPWGQPTVEAADAVPCYCDEKSDGLLGATTHMFRANIGACYKSEPGVYHTCSLAGYCSLAHNDCTSSFDLFCSHEE